MPTRGHRKTNAAGGRRGPAATGSDAGPHTAADPGKDRGGHGRGRREASGLVQVHAPEIIPGHEQAREQNDSWCGSEWRRETAHEWKARQVSQCPHDRLNQQDRRNVGDAEHQQALDEPDSVATDCHGATLPKNARWPLGGGAESSTASDRLGK